jgi:type IV secretion system protein VirB6
MGASQEGINSMALQQGGLGLILTVLIVTAPPMAASFFQGMLGQFSAYNQFSSSQTPPGQSARMAPALGYSAGGIPQAPAPSLGPATSIAAPTTYMPASTGPVRDEVRQQPQRRPMGEDRA